MAEKVTSMRLDEDDIEEFRKFIKDNKCSNQAEAFKSLLDMVKLENVKEKLGDRGKEIQAFKETINRAIGMYTNSLEVNASTENTIREELRKEIKLKDDTIINVMNQLEEVKTENDILKSNNKELDNKLKELQDQLNKSNIDNSDKQKNIDKLNSSNDLLQENLKEYKEYKDINKNLELQLNELKADNSKKDNTINNLTNKVKQLEDKVMNDSDMLEFYKNNIHDLKNTIQSYKKDIKALEDECRQEVITIKADQQSLLEKQIQGNTDMLNNLHLIELQKKDLEIQKLNNALEQLQHNSKKRTSKTEA